jgi:diamine N-acetyltransferase
MRVQRATLADTEVIAQLKRSIHALHCQLAPEYFSSASHDAVVAALKPALSEKGSCCFIAWEGGLPIGYCLVKTIEREPNAWTTGFRRLLIDQLSVEPDCRRRGAGRLLMEAAYEFAREQGIHEITLEYWMDNDTARNFYDALGFVPLTEKVMLKIGDAARPQ